MASACTPSIPKDEAAEISGVAIDGTDSEWLPAALSAVTFAAIGAETDPVRASEGIDRLRLFVTPATCVGPRVSVGAAASQLVLTHCEGANFDDISGTVSFVFRSEGALLVVHVESGDLTSRIGTESFSFDTSRQLVGNTHLQWTGSVKARTVRGRTLERTVAMSSVTPFGPGCPRLNGASTGTIDGRPLAIEVVDVERCHRSCPDSGLLQLTLANPDAKYSLTYDDEGIGLLEGGDREREVRLPCAKR